jgi:hypothetical protein
MNNGVGTPDDKPIKATSPRIRRYGKPSAALASPVVQGAKARAR